VWLAFGAIVCRLQQPLPVAIEKFPMRRRKS
jgi:hypothetical protein